MCIIVIQPEGHLFKEDAILDFHERNPHGFGFMWVDARGLHGVRGVPRDGNEAVAMYLEHAAGRAGVLHYRYATSGLVNAAMAHPFAVSRDLLVVHNGVLPGGNERESDTFQFVRDVLKPTLGKDHKRLRDPKVQDTLEQRIRGSSLVFLDKDGRVTRLGSVGMEYDGCWYSNTYAWSVPWGVLEEDGLEGGLLEDDAGWWLK